MLSQFKKRQFSVPGANRSDEMESNIASMMQKVYRVSDDEILK